MANLNKVMLIGRLTRDPEPILEGKGAKFGFAVNNRRQNQTTQQWEDVPVFIDMEVWNRGEMGQQATRVLQTLRKGQQVFIEGHLKLDTWDDKNGGGKQSKLRVVVENFQYLEPRADGAGGENGGMMRAAPRQPLASSRQAAPAPVQAGGYDQYEEPSGMAAPPSRGGSGGAEEDIPF
jgi:single-strand DNA-binding protein